MRYLKIERYSLFELTEHTINWPYQKAEIIIIFTRANFEIGLGAVKFARK
jgi:hypothetical protein